MGRKNFVWGFVVMTTLTLSVSASAETGFTHCLIGEGALRAERW